MMNQWRAVWILGLLLVCQPAHGGDSTASQGNHQIAEGGFLVSVGGSYHGMSGGFGELVDTDPSMFNAGLELAYRRFFISLDWGWWNAEVRDEFEKGDTWPEGLPLDAENISLGIGTRFSLGEQFALKPMFTISWLKYNADDRVQSFTDIDRSYQFTAMGLSVGSIIHSPEDNYQGWGIGAGVEWEASGEDNTYSGSVIWRLSLAVFINPFYLAR